MSSIINALTSGGGIALTGDTSGQLQLQTNNGTTAVTIDTSQNVGIGTASPSSIGKLGVYGGNIGIQLGANTTGTIDFYNINTTKINQIKYDDSDGSLTIGSVTGGAYPTKFQIAGTERMRIDTSGNLLVGTSASSLTGGSGFKAVMDASFPAFGIVGTATSGAYAGYSLYSTGASAYRFFVTYAGQINATSTSITAISDESLKENIKDLETGLTEVMALKPRRFDWKEETKIGEKNVAGFIAQEVEAVLPDLVYDYQYNDTDIKKSVKMGDILPTLVKAIQEQQAIITQLQADVAALKGVK